MTKNLTKKIASSLNLTAPSSSNTISSGGSSKNQAAVKVGNSIYWFRKALRLHDNPALVHALENSERVYPIFILDPWFVQNARVGPNRWRFLIQTLNDLNSRLLELNSRLILVRGLPSAVFEQLIKEWHVELLCFELDTEPYAKTRDASITELATSLKCHVVTKCSHTLYNPHYLFEKNDSKVPGTYTSFRTLLSKIGDPPRPVDTPGTAFNKLPDVDYDKYKIPTLEELGVDLAQLNPTCVFPGGEREALRRMAASLADEPWVCAFEKPETSPNSLKPSTTVLSPYLKFGCLSARLFFYKLKDIYRKSKKHSQPPVSLEGQMLFREWFYLNGAHIPNFDRIEGNPICRQIKWDENEAYLDAWRNARTGYPFIDAIMTQLRQEGWIHHLGIN